jgi:DNA-binding response OmpR family regulator
MSDVWGEPGGVATNVVDVYINSLRKKVERRGTPKMIQTVRGSGYSLVDDAAASLSARISKQGTVLADQ